MRKTIVMVTVIMLILSILSTGLIVLVESNPPTETPVVSGGQ